MFEQRVASQQAQFREAKLEGSELVEFKSELKRKLALLEASSKVKAF